MDIKKYKLIAGIFISLSIACCSAQSAFSMEIGRVSYAEGRVDILKGGAEKAIPIRQDEAVSLGDSIRTKSNSKAEITFNDKTRVRLAQNSKIDVKDYQLDADNRRKTATIVLKRGKIRTIIAKMASSAEFNINTPNAKGTVRGSDIFAFYQAGNSGMLVESGRLSVANIANLSESVTVTAGNSVFVPFEEAPKAPRPYVEFEKKLYEQDTNVPFTISKKDGTILKGVIFKFSGDVKITSGNSTVPHKAVLNEIIGEGDRINTGEKGIVEIRLDNGNAVTLKPNTDLLITRLTFDPKTGEYENLFESNMGKIRARIEGLKGKSRFEVKTPTAVSGARGTIMYLDIIPGMTKASFEGGEGYIKNIISGIIKTISAGASSSADSSGSITEPIIMSQEERSSSGEGWDPGSGVEGYSSPGGGGSSGYGFGANPGTTDPSLMGTGAGNNNGQGAVDVPFSWRITMSSSPLEVLAQSWRAMLIGSGRANPESPISLSWIAEFSGLKLPEEGLFEGTIKGLWLNLNILDGQRGLSAGSMAGNFVGNYNGEDWQIFDPGYAYEFIENIDTTNINTINNDVLSLARDDFPIAIVSSAALNGYSIYYLNGGKIPIILFSNMDISFYSIMNEELYGIWAGLYRSIYYFPGETGTWETTFSGRDGSRYFFADVSDGRYFENGTALEGSIEGVWLAGGEEGLVKAGTISGGAAGNYVDIDSESGIWQAAAVGEWVEASSLLDEHAMFGEAGLARLNDFVSVPVTEVYSTIMTGAGTGGIASASMNMNLYATSPIAMEGIWTAIINGSYAGTVGPGWTATFNNDAGSAVTLEGAQWENGNWVANVSGTVNNNSITSGQAGGTYSDGTFSGVGAGNWQAPS